MCHSKAKWNQHAMLEGQQLRKTHTIPAKSGTARKGSVTGTKWSAACQLSTTNALQQNYTRVMLTVSIHDYQSASTKQASTITYSILRLMKGIWVETFTIPKWQLRKQRNRTTGCSNPSMQTHPNHVCVAHKPLMLVMEDNLTHVIPKVCIFFLVGYLQKKFM